MLKPGLGRTHRSYLWSYSSSEYDDLQAVVYAFALRGAAEYVMKLDSVTAAGVAAPFLKMFGITLGAALLAKQAGKASDWLNTKEGNMPFMKAKIATTSFFIENLLPHAAALAESIQHASSGSLSKMTEEQFVL